MITHEHFSFRQLFQTLCVVAGLALASGCSAFDHDWDASAGTRPANATDISGRWIGTWQSDAGHSGGLRCLITKTNAQTYHARYAATYGTILHFGYEMDLGAEPEAEWVKFQGQADLGSLAGGVYHYEGHANSTQYFATYQSDSDKGRFTLKRPE